MIRMRLIDADETIKQYTQIFVEKYGIECGEMFQGVLKQMPTAYDVDKVIEEIEEWTARINVINDNSGKVGQVDVIGSNKAIKIVEGGGIDGNTNT